jgi:hypothetical protein
MAPTTAELREALNNALKSKAHYLPYSEARAGIDRYIDNLLEKLHKLLTRH